MSAPAPIETVSVATGSVNGDGLLDKFHLAALTFRRARQLQNGARPRVEVGGHKVLRVALLEVMGGMVSWSLTEKAVLGQTAGARLPVEGAALSPKSIGMRRST